MAELTNPLLQQAEAKIENGVTGETKQNYSKIVVAGMHAALDKGPQGLLASLAQSQDPIADAAKGAVSLVIILRKQAHGVMPLKAAVPAAMTLMLKALDFVDRSKVAKVGNAELVRATHIFADFLFARFGITKQGLANAAQRVHAISQDPQAVAAMTAKAHQGTAGPPGLPGSAMGPAAGLINSGAAGGGQAP